MAEHPATFRSPGWLAARRFRRNRLAVFGLAVLLVMVLACGLAYPWSSAAYDRQLLSAQLSPPAASHPLGTDTLGRDMLARTLFGGVFSLAVGILAASVAVAIGVAWGAVAGYFGGRTDNFMMRIVDVLYGLPYILLVVLLTVAVGRRWWILFLAIGGVSWLTMARVVRGQVLILRELPYIEAARAAGASAAHIIIRHMLPNLIGPIVVYATLTVPTAILQESFLSFLGIGMPPDYPTWGALAAEGVDALNPYKNYWWLVTFPCLALGLTLLALNFVGDGLRDAFDPQSDRSRR